MDAPGQCMVRSRGRGPRLHFQWQAYLGRARSKRVSVNRTFSADVYCCMDSRGACSRLAIIAAPLALNTYWLAPLQSCADRRDKHFSPMRCAAVFEEENTLPRSELHFSVHNRHRLAGARQDHADV